MALVRYDPDVRQRAAAARLEAVLLRLQSCQHGQPREEAQRVAVGAAVAALQAQVRDQAALQAQVIDASLRARRAEDAQASLEDDLRAAARDSNAVLVEQVTALARLLQDREEDLAESQRIIESLNAEIQRMVDQAHGCSDAIDGLCRESRDPS